MQLAIAVLLVVILSEVIGLVGKTYISAMAYDVYLKIMHKEKMAKQRQLKKEVLTTKNELAKTSSQDEFAKWAKLRRKMDGKIADLEKSTSELHVSKAAFELKFNGLMWFLTSGLQFLMIAWFRRSAVFYLPLGWFGPAERILALPFAPRGSVSITVWFFACRRAITLFSSNLAEFVPAVRALKSDQPADASSNPFAAFANMASMATGAGAGAPGGAAGGNSFAGLAGLGGMGGMPDFAAMAGGAPGGPPGMEGMDPNMFGPGSPFAAMFGQTLGGDTMAGGTASGSSSVRSGTAERRRRA